MAAAKREVICQNLYVLRINALSTQFQNHQATGQQLQLAIDQATHGVQGGMPMQAASLQDLREQAARMNKDLKPLSTELSDMDSYAPEGDSAVSPEEAARKRQLQDQVRFRQGKIAEVQGEIDARDSTIADAQQQRDDLHASGQGLARQHDVLRAARYGRMNLRADLATVATGGGITPEQAKVLGRGGSRGTGPARGGQQSDKKRSASHSLCMGETRF